MLRNTIRFWFVQIMSLATLILFVSLGTWQLGRGNVKSEIEAANTSTDIIYEQVRLPLHSTEQWRYKNIILNGVYDSTKQFLLDNQVRDRAAGYNVLTPLYVLNENTWVLVDRGWIPQGLDRNVLPDVLIDSKDKISVSGKVYVPYGGAYSLGGIAEGEDSQWPRRIQFVDYTLLSERLGVNLQPFTLRLAAKEKYGYRRDWHEASVTAQKHYGYSFQWYAMALAIIVLWWIYSIKPLIKTNEKRKF